MRVLRKIVVKYMWHKFVIIGYEARKNKRDGLRVWQDKSKDLNHSVNYTWSTNGLGLLDKLILLGFNQDRFDKSSEHDLWEELHFVYQLGSIPKLKEPSMASLMQIAYNYGSALYVAKNKDSYSKLKLKELGFEDLNNVFKFIEL